MGVSCKGPEQWILLDRSGMFSNLIMSMIWGISRREQKSTPHTSLRVRFVKAPVSSNRSVCRHWQGTGGFGIEDCLLGLLRADSELQPGISISAFLLRYFYNCKKTL